MKNRVIRASDALWASVTEAAKAQEWAVPHFVRQCLYRAIEPKKCFLCGAPAVVEHSVNLTKGTDLTFEQIIVLAKDRQTFEDTYTPIKIVVCACEDHKGGADDYFLDRDYGVGGFALKAGPSFSERDRVEPSDDAYKAVADAMGRLSASTPV